MKKVFLCGAGSGFGLELAHEFKKNKFEVILNSRKTVDGFENNFVLDMNDIKATHFEEYSPEFIVNNGFDKKSYFHSFEASVNIVTESLNYFKKLGGGTLININSFYGLNPDTKDPYYAAAKYGLRGYVESVSKEAFENNIKIINFYPRAIGIGLNDGREDIELLIDPKEICSFIVKNIDYKTFYLSNVQIDRTT
ncbi:SDR family NAD(P)-dependent oxidoreductase [Acidimicrobiaceae bacterium]|nr:SDR family NAD(P)-dependent oxidoreductase [Acidimicrobiaceae bacterium]